MQVSRSSNEPQKFNEIGEGDILGMGANAIVHRVQLSSTLPDGGHRDAGWTPVNVGLNNSPEKLRCGDYDQTSRTNHKNHGELKLTEWDAAVKRPFSLAKMLVFLQNSQEAGLAKRLRLANLLNSDKRVLYFYGLGLGLSTSEFYCSTTLFITFIDLLDLTKKLKMPTTQINSSSSSCFWLNMRNLSVPTQ